MANLVWTFLLSCSLFRFVKHFEFLFSITYSFFFLFLLFLFSLFFFSTSFFSLLPHCQHRQHHRNDDEINLLYLLPLLILSFVLILLPVAAFSPENCLPSVVLNGVAASRKSDHDFKQITFRGNRLKPRPDGLESSSPT